MNIMKERRRARTSKAATARAAMATIFFSFPFPLLIDQALVAFACRNGVSTRMRKIVRQIETDDGSGRADST